MRSVQRLAYIVLALAMACGHAAAQDYPNRTITLIVPLAAGGGMDFIARTIGQKLSERLGRPVLIENRPGGGTVVAAVALAKAAPDGYTLALMPSATLTTHATVYKTLPYDPRKDFVPIALTSQVSFALVVNPALPVHSVADLVKYAREKPGELVIGTAGVATTTHLSGELLAHKAGVKFRYAHYRGSPPAMNDVIAGHVHMMFADPVTGAALARDGKVRALAVSGRSRISVFPEIAPIAEAGVPGYDSTTWHMVVAPANTPANIVDRLSAEIRAVGAMPDVKDKVNKIGLTPLDGMPPAELKAFLDKEITDWGKFVTQIGIAGSL
jgi:tripartite-type tricarboxylate transporter receptor subunit TctC